MKVRISEIGLVIPTHRICDLTDAFPGDPDALLAAREDLIAYGVHYRGGGGAPLFRIETINGRAREP